MKKTWILHQSFILLIAFTSLSFYGWAIKKPVGENETPEAVKARADFLIKIAQNMEEEVTIQSSFVIGVFGRSKTSELLYQELNSRKVLIKGKPLAAEWYKRNASIGEPNLLYLNDSKVNLEKIYSKLAKNCFIVTENFPYGQTPINFFVDDDNKLSYVIDETQVNSLGKTIAPNLLTSQNRIKNKTDWQAKLEQAQQIIQKQVQRIEGQKEILSQKDQSIVEGKKTISEQKQILEQKNILLAQNKKIISQQRIILWIIISAIVVGSILAFFLFINSKKLKRALELSEFQKKEIISSINYAKRIQGASLPAEDQLDKVFGEGFIHYQPKDIVSGDFYWIEDKGDDVYVAVADCTGHGVPGAMLAVLCSNTLYRALHELELKSPGKILDSTVELLDEFFSRGQYSLQDGMDIVLCRINKKTRVVEYAGANRPLIYFIDGVMHEKKADRYPIGKLEKRIDYTTHSIRMSAGDTLYMFTDGMVDQFGGEKGKKFSIARLKQLLKDVQQQPMQQQKKIIEQNYITYKGNEEQIDDNCIIGIRMS